MSALFLYLLRSGACLAAFYLFYRLFLMKDTNFALNRAFLMGSAALSLLLPLARVPSPFIKTVTYSPSPALPIAAEAASVARSAPVLEPGAVLLAVYAAGAGLFLLLFLVRMGRLAYMAGRCGCSACRR